MGVWASCRVTNEQGGGGGQGRQFPTEKNNKRTMKGSWSDLTTIACSVLTTVMMNSWNEMCFTSCLLPFLSVPGIDPHAPSQGQHAAHSETLLRIYGCDSGTNFATNEDGPTWHMTKKYFFYYFSFGWFCNKCKWYHLVSGRVTHATLH